MREYSLRPTGTRDQRIEDAVEGHIEWTTADEPDAWHALLPALQIKTDPASGVRYCSRNGVEAYIGLCGPLFNLALRMWRPRRI